jgi:hypothetical protein
MTTPLKFSKLVKMVHSTTMPVVELPEHDLVAWGRRQREDLYAAAAERDRALAEVDSLRREAVRVQNRAAEERLGDRLLDDAAPRNAEHVRRLPRVPPFTPHPSAMDLEDWRAQYRRELGGESR